MPYYNAGAEADVHNCRTLRLSTHTHRGPYPSSTTVLNSLLCMPFREGTARVPNRCDVQTLRLHFKQSSRHATINFEHAEEHKPDCSGVP